MGSFPPWPVVQEMLLKLVLPSFAAAAGLFAVICVLTRRRSLRMIGGAAAVVAGLAAGNHFRELLTWWPLDPAALAAAEDDVSRVSWWQVERGWTALLPATALAMCGGVAATFLSVRTQRGMGLAIRLITACLCALWVTDAMEPASLPVTFAVIFAGIVLNWEAGLQLDRIGTARVALPLVAMIWGGAAATVLIFAHSARFCDLAVLMTSAFLGATLIAAVWGQNAAVLFSAPAVFIPGLMLGGAVNTFSEVPPMAFGLVAFTPCVLWLVLLPRLRRWPLRFQAAAAVLAVTIPCAAASFMAARNESLDFGNE